MNAVFHIITQAIDGHRLLNVVDEAGGRIVEPYLIYESDGGDMVLHGWQLAHVPLSIALVVLAMVHIVMALRF